MKKKILKKKIFGYGYTYKCMDRFGKNYEKTVMRF